MFSQILRGCKQPSIAAGSGDAQCPDPGAGHDALPVATALTDSNVVFHVPFIVGQAVPGAVSNAASFPPGL